MFLDNLMGRVEIINETNDMEVVYFQIPRKIKKFWNTYFISEYRDRLIENVSRDNPEEKVKDFFERSIDLMYAVDHQARLARTKKCCRGLGHLLYQMISNRRLLIMLTLIITLALNGIVLYAYDTKVNDGTASGEENEPSNRSIT